MDAGGIRERLGSVALGLMIIGGLMVFYSLAILVVFPESEHSAFPLPLGAPGIIVMLFGGALYALARSARMTRAS